MEVEDCREEFSGARQTDGEAHGKARQGKKAGQGKGSIACRERRGRSVTSAMATPYTLRRIRVYRFRGDVTTYYTSNGDTRGPLEPPNVRVRSCQTARPHLGAARRRPFRCASIARARLSVLYYQPRVPSVSFSLPLPLFLSCSRFLLLSLAPSLSLALGHCLSAASPGIRHVRISPFGQTSGILRRI